MKRYLRPKTTKMNAAPQPYADLITNLQHSLTTIAEEPDMWLKMIWATTLFEDITNTPRQQAFLLEAGEGEKIFLQINELVDMLDQEPIAQADQYYPKVTNELADFIRLGHMAINIRRNPDSPESKYNQTIMFQYQTMLGRKPARLPYDGLGHLLKGWDYTLEEVKEVEEPSNPYWDCTVYTMEIPRSLRDIFS